LDVVQKIWAPLGKLFAPHGVPSWLRVSKKSLLAPQGCENPQLRTAGLDACENFHCKVRKWKKEFSTTFPAKRAAVWPDKVHQSAVQHWRAHSNHQLTGQMVLK